MGTPTLTSVDGIHVLRLGDDENRFSPDWLTAVEGALEEIAARPAPLVTVGDGKQYSSGLDLDWVGQHPDQFIPYAARVERVFARVLTLGVPTVAAINGHAFAAGAMLALSHDWRVMRADRGFFCLPEVDIHIPFTTGMAALIQAKLSPRAANDAMTTGRRYGGEEAAAAGIADATASEDEVLSTALAMVAPLAGKDPATLAAIKATMYADVDAKLGS
ncbi:enoyl-CoA hydratase-related protein [Nocardioides nematodiphilus]|uniref:enoyl-CoA hydratase-related protein n=1 Tax=Nocardioides nematodiphilus TaxID=2849669 RepID=UPI001CD996CC|nr:enoyl-CoA hydratase-related protein [Nocardioides nematodiphilus]MCA1982241.1 enoyl-CoA hydratase/isomerase family protein [Nocardioides nematodiphilus]